MVNVLIGLTVAFAILCTAWVIWPEKPCLTSHVEHRAAYTYVGLIPVGKMLMPFTRRVAEHDETVCDRRAQ